MMERACLSLAAWAVLASAAQAAETKSCRILLTNDDGVSAPGIHAAYDALSTLCDVVISAPAKDQSGASHAIFNTSGGVRVTKVILSGGVTAYSVEGSPAEAAAVGIFALSDGRRFDLVVSGVNRGENLGLGNLYSGTVNAAMEGALRGVPAIAVSQSMAYGKDYAYSATLTRRLAGRALSSHLRADAVLNVNIPKDPKGVKVVASGGLTTAFKGFAVLSSEGDTTVYRAQLADAPPATDPGDIRAYQSGYVTITPLAVDRTSPQGLARTHAWQDLDIRP